MMKEGNCSICGKSFRKRYAQNRKEPMTCSKECYYKRLKTQLWTDDKYKKHMSEAHKGNAGYWTGKKRPDMQGVNNNKWKGGIYEYNKEGYIKIGFSNKGKNTELLKHRIVIMLHLGRELKPDEVVHHINHNKLDNRIENLQLMTISEHLQHHWDTDWKHRRKLKCQQ